MATEKFLGTYSLRPLNPGEVYYCKNGCGECQKQTIEDDNVRITADDGATLIERQYSTVEVSSCCKADVGIWNDADDVEVDVDYDFKPASES